MIKKFSLIVYSLLAVFILSGCDDSSMGYAKLEENEVGILLNNITGTMTVETVAGMKMFMPVLKSFYTLDKREQTLEMTADASSGSRFSKDDIKIKTIDGSDVYVDMTIQYRIIASMADTIIMDSGPGQNYKFKWIRDYSRSTARLEFGELTTEEFYNSTKRTQKANEIRDTLNIMLASHGLEVTNVIPQNFRFYAEYEKKIKEKKGADQEVDKQTLRWSHFKRMGAETMLTHVQMRVFPFLKQLNGDESPFTEHMKNAVFIIPKPSRLVEAISTIEEIFT